MAMFNSFLYVYQRVNVGIHIPAPWVTYGITTSVGYVAVAPARTAWRTAAQRPSTQDRSAVAPGAKLAVRIH